MFQSSVLVDVAVVVLVVVGVVAVLVPAPRDMVFHIELAQCKCNWLDMHPHHVVASAE
jgi:hypothetical protein